MKNSEGRGGEERELLFRMGLIINGKR